LLVAKKCGYDVTYLYWYQNFDTKLVQIKHFYAPWMHDGTLDLVLFLFYHFCWNTLFEGFFKLLKIQLIRLIMHLNLKNLQTKMYMII